VIGQRLGEHFTHQREAVLLDAFGGGRDERASRQMRRRLFRDGAHEARGHHEQHEVRVL
jgi:hypothetical protein